MDFHNLTSTAFNSALSFGDAALAFRNNNLPSSLVSALEKINSYVLSSDSLSVLKDLPEFEISPSFALTQMAGLGAVASIRARRTADAVVCLVGAALVAQTPMQFALPVGFSVVALTANAIADRRAAKLKTE